jgi:excisionase family DNA binding protein
MVSEHNILRFDSGSRSVVSKASYQHILCHKEQSMGTSLLRDLREALALRTAADMKMCDSLIQLVQAVEQLSNNMQPSGTSELRKSTKRFYTTKETCEILGISRNTLWEWRRTGKIGFTRIGSRPFHHIDHIEEYERQMLNRTRK